MIKPAAYWALHKHSDPVTLGRIGVALAGRENELEKPLTREENLIVAMVRQDSEWFDERCEGQRERWKERQKKRRATTKTTIPDITTNVTQCHRDKPMSRDVTVTNVTSECHRDKPMSRDVTVTNECHDTSLPPSLPPIHTSKDVCVCNTRAHAHNDFPDQKTVVDTAAKEMGVSPDYAAWWHNEMTVRGWTTTAGDKITSSNWRAHLKAWHNRATQQELAQAAAAYKQSKAAHRQFRPKDWALCEERCKNCQGHRCLAGHTVPPDLREYPIPPEECTGYAQKTA